MTKKTGKGKIVKKFRKSENFSEIGVKSETGGKCIMVSEGDGRPCPKFNPKSFSGNATGYKKCGVYLLKAMATDFPTDRPYRRLVPNAEGVPIIHVADDLIFVPCLVQHHDVTAIEF